MPGLNDLATTHPELAAQAHDWDPTTCMAGSNEKRHWRCAQDTSGTPSWPAGRWEQLCRLLWANPAQGLNVGHQYPDLAAEADGWDPTSLVAGSKKKAAWCCAAGHHWTATVSSRTRANAAGCPTCAGYGFSSAEPAWLYLFEHPTWGLLQIGITNAPETRLSKHEKAGWVLLDVRGPMNGDMTRSWEAADPHHASPPRRGPRREHLRRPIRRLHRIVAPGVAQGHNPAGADGPGRGARNTGRNTTFLIGRGLSARGEASLVR